jgi:hypothetical protein
MSYRHGFGNRSLNEPYTIKASKKQRKKESDMAYKLRPNLLKRVDSSDDDEDDDFVPRYGNDREYVHELSKDDVEQLEDAASSGKRAVTRTKTPSGNMGTMKKIWLVGTELLLKCAQLKLDNNNIQKETKIILKLLTNFYNLMMSLFLLPCRIGRNANNIKENIKEYTIGLVVCIIIGIILYQTVYGKIVIDFLISVTNYLINIDGIKANINETMEILREKAWEAITKLAFVNYILSLIKNSTFEAGQQVINKVGEQVGEMGKDIITNQNLITSDQTSILTQYMDHGNNDAILRILDGVKERVEDPIQLGMIAAGVEGGRQGALMIENMGIDEKLADQARLSYNILNNMLTQGDMEQLKETWTLQLKANQITNILLTDAEVKNAETHQELMNRIQQLSSQVEYSLGHMEKDINLLTDFIDNIDKHSQLTDEKLKEILHTLDENLKTTKIGNFLNYANFNSQALIEGVQAAINTVNILKGQNAATRQFLLKNHGGKSKRRQQKRKGTKKKKFSKKTKKHKKRNNKKSHKK